MMVPHYEGFIDEDRLERSKSFVVTNLIGSRTFGLRGSEKTTLRLYGALMNVTDDVQRDFDQGPLRDAGYIYGPMQMRQVTFGLTLRF
jgi:outer membrane receptor for ferrienterochelin and colicins